MLLKTIITSNTIVKILYHEVLAQDLLLPEIGTMDIPKFGIHLCYVVLCESVHVQVQCVSCVVICFYGNMEYHAGFACSLAVWQYRLVAMIYPLVRTDQFNMLRCPPISDIYTSLQHAFWHLNKRTFCKVCLRCPNYLRGFAKCSDVESAHLVSFLLLKASSVPKTEW